MSPNVTRWGLKSVKQVSLIVHIQATIIMMMIVKKGIKRRPKNVKKMMTKGLQLFYVQNEDFKQCKA